MRLYDGKVQMGWLVNDGNAIGIDVPEITKIRSSNFAYCVNVPDYRLRNIS